MGGFIGVDIERPLTPRKRTVADELREKIRDNELLSTAGTLIANSSAVVTAWKFLSNVPATILTSRTIGFWFRQVCSFGPVNLRMVYSRSSTRMRRPST